MLRPRLAAPRWRPSAAVLGAGGALLLIGGVITLAPWYEAWQWQASPEMLRAQRNADAPQPIWLTPDVDSVTRTTPGLGVAAGTPRPVATSIGLAPGSQAAVGPDRRSGDPIATPGLGVAADGRPVVDPEPAAAGATTRPGAEVGPAGAAPGGPVDAPAGPPDTPTPAPSNLELLSSEFRFLDPPEPGAAARLTVSVNNPTDQPSGPIVVALPLDWLAGYAVQSTDPPQTDNTPARGQRVGGALHLTFDGPPAQSQLTVGVDLKATDEVIDPPLVDVLETDGRVVGRAQPPTEAPQPRAGPVWGVTIPRLNLTAGVVQVDWEPPLFVVGQIRASAHVTEGNSVLVGHVRGAAGYNVFDHLDQLKIGDTIVATSRGMSYQFVIDQTQVLPEDDTSPTDATSTPRLTLMTCAGEWNPITRDYSDRLWVIAEPPALAAATIAARAASEPAAATPASATLRPQVALPGVLGSLEVDLTSALGPPNGESRGKLAVFPEAGQRPEERAQLMDVPAPAARRAGLVVAIPPTGAPLTFDAAVKLSRTLLPRDAEPRAGGPEGNPRFAVERFTSPALAAVLPSTWFADRQAQPGDFLVVYARRSDGRITAVGAGIGDDAEALLAAMDK